MTTTTDPAALRLATELASQIANHRTQRVPVDTLWEWTLAAEPTLNGDPRTRTRLADAITHLADTGVVLTPQARTGWDTREHPPLPRWVRRPPTPPTPHPEPADRVWPTTLEAVAATYTRPDEHAVLARIADWLRDHPHPVWAPIEERSLELFNDEKALTRAATSRLFTTGALTLNLLACGPVVAPLITTTIPGHDHGPPTLLIVENKATWYSVATAARTHPQQLPPLHVAWGIGRQIVSNIPAANNLTPTPQHLRYFGDLDLAGLQIAAAAGATAHTVGLPTLHPVTAWYEWLLDHGTPQPDSSNPNRITDTDALTWLPHHLHRPVTRLLATGQRLPQEHLGIHTLTTHPHLLHAAWTAD